MIAEVKSMEDVAEFVSQLVDEGLNYHPDDDFENYVNMETGEASYTAAEALERNRLNRKCFEVCDAAGADIYNISMEIFLKKTGLDKYIPLPSSIIEE
jgi:hypothetical protein